MLIILDIRVVPNNTHHQFIEGIVLVLEYSNIHISIWSVSVQSYAQSVFVSMVDMSHQCHVSRGPAWNTSAGVT